MNKIRHYFSTLEIIRGLLLAMLSSGFIYLSHWGLSHPLFNTILSLASLFLLLLLGRKTWFWYGVFVGVFWFWWIALSLQHYGYAWGLPFGIVIVAFIYGLIFWFIAWVANKTALLAPTSFLLPLIVKSTGLLLLSYLHPFGFDWLKPELMFVESYIGIEKWQFGLVLLSISLTIWRKNLLFLLLILLTYQPTQVAHTNNTSEQDKQEKIKIITTQTGVKDKWDTSLHAEQFKKVFQSIDEAIANNHTLVILPESVFPVFLNRNQTLIDTLQEKAKHISIVLGGLYWDGKTPRNSTYIFANNKITVANKVVLVPFGESNPLPDFLSDWVNKVFYDGAIDYEASSDVIDYQINGSTYRNAICFEATSEKLYEGSPKNMIVLSNNGWFMPSIEPTLQKLLLQYYANKYGTTIYHAVNMSESYIITQGTKGDL